MNTQVEKLEELLARVQKNRAKPQTAPAARPLAADRQFARDSADSVLERERILREKRSEVKPQALFDLESTPSEAVGEPEITQPPDSIEEAAPMGGPIPKKTGTPLEAAVENHMESAGVATAASSMDEIAIEEVMNDSVQPIALPTEPIAKPIKAVAEVVSKHPSMQELTFGVLLKRTLSLRPR
ncbi:MAG: hypothetical protein JXA30_14300 [Deltaproteobacteria bacterium]|nr:hypothetical protein [Deltaproteobacteria bacterium]